MCISICESISISYPLYLLLKGSLQSKSVWKEFTTGFKYPYLLNVYPNVSRSVQRYIDKEFLINLGLPAFPEVSAEKVTLIAGVSQLFVSRTFLNGIAWKNTIFSEVIV